MKCWMADRHTPGACHDPLSTTLTRFTSQRGTGPCTSCRTLNGADVRHEEADAGCCSSWAGMLYVGIARTRVGPLQYPAARTSAWGGQVRLQEAFANAKQAAKDLLVPPHFKVGRPMCEWKVLACAHSLADPVTPLLVHHPAHIAFILPHTARAERGAAAKPQHLLALPAALAWSPPWWQCRARAPTPRPHCMWAAWRRA